MLKWIQSKRGNHWKESEQTLLRRAHHKRKSELKQNYKMWSEATRFFFKKKKHHVHATKASKRNIVLQQIQKKEILDENGTFQTNIITSTRTRTRSTRQTKPAHLMPQAGENVTSRIHLTNCTGGIEHKGIPIKQLLVEHEIHTASSIGWNNNEHFPSQWHSCRRPSAAKQGWTWSQTLNVTCRL